MKKLYILRRLKYRFGLYKPPSLSRKVFLVVITLAVFLQGTVFLLEDKLTPAAQELAASSLSNEILAKANSITANTIAENNLSYQSIVNINTSSDGRVSAITTDFSQLNAVKSQIAVRLSDYLNSSQKKVCYVPVGSLVSGKLLSASGFCIPAAFICTSDVEVEFSDNFTSGGINTTYHKIFLQIRATTNISNIFSSKTVQTTADIPIAETLIPGEVPEFSAFGDFKTAPSEN